MAGRQRRQLYYHNGRLKGKYLTDEDCDILDRIIEMSDDNGTDKPALLCFGFPDG